MAVDPYQLLQALEDKLPMLSDADQQFVVGCQATLNIAQEPLKPEQVARLIAIVNTVRAAEHNTMGLGAPLSLTQVFKDLSGAVHMLTPNEHALALKLSRQFSKGVAIEQVDMEKLFNIHAAKGF